jgi:parvulin-like peptidyl-prolyl isomerase
VRFVRHLLTLIAPCAIIGSLCAPTCAQEMMDVPDPGGAAQAPGDVGPLMPFTPDMVSRQANDGVQLGQADTANLDGCKVVARIDDQIILACEVLWRVNKLIEDQKKKMAEGQEVKKEEIDAVRQQLMKREVAMLVDRKLLFNEFRRNVPPENLPRIEENLRQPFEEKKLPQLYEQLGVKNQNELEQELARLGSSIADERRAFNEQIIAAEWIHSKVKVNEEISPDEMLEYYKAHLADYDYPTQARWEEIAVRKDKFKDPAEAYAALALMGNEVWQRGTVKPVKGAAFAEVAKAKSDGFTAEKGGEHDWTTKGSLQCKAVDDSLFSLQVGQMSPILDSGTMFHIVRVLERKDAGRKSFTDVQADIRDRLKEKRYQVEVESYLARLRGEARIWTAFTGNISADTLLGRKPDEKKQR